VVEGGAAITLEHRRKRSRFRTARFLQRASSSADVARFPRTRSVQRRLGRRTFSRREKEPPPSVGRNLDRENVTEALSAASELQHVGLAEALELCLLLRDKAPERYPRAALRWHGRLCREVDVSLEEAQAILAALVVMAGERKENAAYALADLLSRPRAGASLRDTCGVGARGVEPRHRHQEETYGPQ
jgi:hypothetical protein